MIQSLRAPNSVAMTPDEASKILRALEERALEQVAMLQRIAGYVNVMKGIMAVCAVLLLLILIAHK
jgi:hypothetical protein